MLTRLGAFAFVLPTKLIEIGIDGREIERVVSWALSDPCASANPLALTPGAVQRILQAAGI